MELSQKELENQLRELNNKKAINVIETNAKRVELQNEKYSLLGELRRQMQEVSNYWYDVKIELQEKHNKLYEEYVAEGKTDIDKLKTLNAMEVEYNKAKHECSNAIREIDYKIKDVRDKYSADIRALEQNSRQYSTDIDTQKKELLRQFVALYASSAVVTEIDA